jgi:hypothetical protein
MKILLTFLLIFHVSSLIAQELNMELKWQLDTIYYKDQALREISQPQTTNYKKQRVLREFKCTEDEFTKNGWRIIADQDSLNLISVTEIIEKYGYPGKTLVGEPTNKSAWYVIQHSKEIEKYFPVVKKAGENNEIPMTLVAMMEDRMLMDQGLEQIYGSQGNGKYFKNKETGQYEYIMIIWPIKDPENVNELRKSIGFKTTIEEYSKILGIDYKVYSIEEINKPIEK